MPRWRCGDFPGGAKFAFRIGGSGEPFWSPFGQAVFHTPCIWAVSCQNFTIFQLDIRKKTFIASNEKTLLQMLWKQHKSAPIKLKMDAKYSETLAGGNRFPRGGYKRLAESDLI